MLCMPCSAKLSIESSMWSQNLTVGRDQNVVHNKTTKWNMCRRGELNVLFAEKLETALTVTLRMIEAQGGMNPDAGVAATRLEMQPRTLSHQRVSIYPSISLRVSPLITYPDNHTPLSTQPIIQQHSGYGRKHNSHTAVPACHHSSQVRTNAEPPLKPSQPSQRMIVLSVTRKILCGPKLITIFCRRFPIE